MKKLSLLLLLLLPAFTKGQIASFTASTDSVCQDSCITFSNTSIGVRDSINWYINGMTIANRDSNIVTVCFTSAGFDTVKLFVFDSSTVDTAIQVVRVKPTPHPFVIGNWSPSCCSVPNSYESYQWFTTCCWGHPGVWDTVYGGVTSSIVGTGPNYYFVVVDSGGCVGVSDTACDCWEGVANNIFRPNNSINLSPNPTSDYLNVMSPVVVSNLAIRNPLGQIVFSNYYNIKEVKIDVTGFTDGLYFMIVNGTEIRKFIKQ